jgi:hypothetical protein
MIDHETEQLHRFLDGQMSDTERVAFEQKLAKSSELQQELETFSELGDLLRDHVEYAVESMEFEGFYDGVEQLISDSEVDESLSFFARVRAFLLSPSSGTAFVLAVICLIFFMQRKETVSETPASQPPIVVEQTPTGGAHLIQVSKPVDKNEPTVIWLLEDEKDGGVDSDSAMEAPF